MTRYISALLAVAVSVPVVAFPASPLADEPSAFLRAHADSPVHWMTWGEAAFARAKAENKPVFVNVGAFTSELGRAMRDQSFAREENAAMLNDNFVCILVDRDDRPDVATFFQAYLNLVKQTQGSPYNIWLTPELKPFDGASYLPPSDEWGKEGFTNATKRVVAAWQADPDAQRRKGEEAIAALAAATAAGAGAPRFAADETQELVDDSATAWRGTYDETNGGFGEAPKHPDPELLRFMLRAGDANRDAALATLRKIAGSAVRDPLDGGFFRYATDAEWKLPYFQKTLADQARLALAYFDAAEIAPDPSLAAAGRGALHYALSLGDGLHGYAAADDGTLEAVIPSFLWTEKEVRTALDRDGADAFLQATGVLPEGNIAPDAYLGIDATGKNVLQNTAVPATGEAAARFVQESARLRAVRAQRAAAPRDDVATSGAHGLLLSALARAVAKSADAKLAEAAKDVFAYLRDQLRSKDGALLARAGRPTPASPRDYALVIAGLHAHAANGDTAARELAVDLLAQLTATYGDGTSGRFFATPESPVPGIAARIVVGAPEGRDLPGTKEAILLTLTNHELGDAALREAIAAQIATDINESPNQPRGDQLLALQSVLTMK